MFGGQPADPFQQFDPVKQAQNVADAQYNSAKSVYLQAAADWINNNIDNRNNGRPITPQPVIPQHQIYSRDDKGEVTSKWVTELTAPVLPPPTPSSPATAFGTQADNYQDAIINMLISIHNDLNQIKTKLGV